MKKPNFFIVGAPRSSTTSIYNYFREIPQVFTAEDKEPHFFCKDFHQEAEKLHGNSDYFLYTDIGTYEKQYKEAKNEKYVIDGSTSYGYSEQAAEEIYDYNPDAKILFVVREPVTLLHSWHSYISYYSEETLPFEQALEAEKERENNWKLIPKNAHHPTRVFYSKIANLDQQIKRYQKVFPKENILILLFDDIKEDTEREFRKILEFLNLEIEQMPDFTVHNANKSSSTGIKKYLDRIIFKNRKRIDKLIPREAKMKIKGLYQKALSKEGKRNPMNDETRERLQKEYIPTVIELEKILGRDLRKLWKYPS